MGTLPRAKRGAVDLSAELAEVVHKAELAREDGSDAGGDLHVADVAQALWLNALHTTMFI